MIHLAVPLCRWSWHPLPSVFTQRLCIHIHSIAFLACCSNLASTNPWYKVHLTLGHGQLRHLLHWTRQGGGHGRWWQMCRSFVVLKRVDNDLGRGLRCKPSCFQHQMIFEKCLKLVGRKWFPFRRFFINGWTVHCFESDECTPTFSLFLYWQDPFTLPCVTACEANTTLYFVSAFVLHLIPFVKLCWPLYKPYQAFLGLPLGEAQGFPIWPFKSVKDVQNVRPGCQPKLAIAQGEPASGQRCLRGRGFSSVWCMRCRMDLERISCSAAEVRRLPSLHSDEFCPFVELTWFITQY